NVALKPHGLPRELLLREGRGLSAVDFGLAVHFGSIDTDETYTGGGQLRAGDVLDIDGVAVHHPRDGRLCDPGPESLVLFRGPCGRLFGRRLRCRRCFCWFGSGRVLRVLVGRCFGWPRRVISCLLRLLLQRAIGALWCALRGRL